MKLKIDQIIIDDDFYPRGKQDNDAIQRYRDSLDSLPPIEVAFINGQYPLVDGKHRIQAHKLEGRTEIEAELREDLKTLNDVLIEAIRKNAAHGIQLVRDDKSRHARQLYGRFNVPQLAAILCVSERAIREWTQNQRALEKFEQKCKALGMYLAGATVDVIAKELVASDETVKGWVGVRGENGTDFHFHPYLSVPDTDDLAEQKRAIIRQYLGDHLLDPTKPPPSLKPWDVWNFTDCDSHYGAKYPGRVPGQIVENLLWYYTEPFANVYDPFAGSGTTVDVCRAMFRRVWSSDVRPYDPQKGTVKHNIAEAKPDFFPKGYKMDFVFIDPPYAEMKDDGYPDGSISRLPVDEFYDAMERVAKHCFDVTKDCGHTALLMMNGSGARCGGDENHRCHIIETILRFRAAGWTIARMIDCPLPTQAVTGDDVNKAKADRRMLGLFRTITVFRKG